MESLPIETILKYNTDSLQSIRKQFNLDHPERIEDAVNILCDWLTKQDHLVKKKFEKDYLERIIINCKGSVERAKSKLDKISSFRTMLPSYFEPFDRKHPSLTTMIDCFLPEMTEDHCRVFLLKYRVQKYDFRLLNFYRALVAKVEYLQMYDYNNGVIVLFDYRELNVLEFLKILNIAEVQQVSSIVTEGYGMRIKGIYIITPSKMVDTLVTIIKQAMSEKLGQRIHVHKNIDSIYNFIPHDIMPKDYGGKEKTLQELHDNFLDELTSDKLQSHMDEMRNARTIESLRREDTRIEHLGIPGSFRKLALD